MTPRPRRTTGTGPPRRWRLVQAGRDAVPASVRRLTARSRGPRLRRLLPWLGGLVAAAVLGTGVWIGYGTGVLGLERIRVEGTDLLDPDQVREVVGLSPGTPLARVDTAAAAARVGELAPVARAEVERDWPHSVVVRVTERTPVAVVPTAAGFRFLDATGTLFHQLPAPPAGLPAVRISGPDAEGRTTRDALEVLAALTPVLREQLVALVADSPTRITLELTGGRTVFWGDASRSDQKADVATVLLAQPGTVYDVSAPDVVTTR